MSYERETGANDGARTRDIQDHNLALYQLSYDRHTPAPAATQPEARATRARGAGFTAAGAFSSTGRRVRRGRA